jgi:hypothetical protein
MQNFQLLKYEPYGICSSEIASEVGEAILLFALNNIPQGECQVNEEHL